MQETAPTGIAAIVTHQGPLGPGLASRAIRFFGKLSEYSQELGFIHGLRWYCAKVLARLRVPGVGRLRMKPPALDHALTVRMFPSSDEFVFDQFFIRHEYDPVLSRLNNPTVILDLGANVGYTSALFASRYPAARILAVEPDPKNYQFCVTNLKPYGDRVRTVLGAVWARPAKLALSRGTSCDGRDWSTQVVEAKSETAATVEAWDMPGLLALTPRHEADLVKIDIEGSEAEVFAAEAGEWLPHVRNICIELHDDRCREIFFGALRGFEYELAEFGELTLCTGIRRSTLQK